MGSPGTMKIELDRAAINALKDLTRAIEKNNDLRRKELNSRQPPIINLNMTGVTGDGEAEGGSSEQL